MKRPAPDNQSGSLFDLPLDHSAQGTHSNAGSANAPALEIQEQAPLPLEPAAESAETGADAEPTSIRGPGTKQRLEGGLLDLAAHLAVLGLAVGGSWWLGVHPSRITLLPLVLFGVGFSFVYHVLPLVFWGHTPGMARSGLVARSLDGGPLTIGQAVRRWLGALLSVVSLGLVFVLGTERTLADRLSASSVRVSS